VFNKVGLIAKQGDQRVGDTLKRLAAYLLEHRCAVRLDPLNGPALSGMDLEIAERHTMGHSCDLVIIIGGDGTFLGAARSLIGGRARLLGINMGRLGFLADVAPDTMTRVLDEVFAGHFVEEERFLLHTTVLRDGQEVVQVPALNDVVAHKWHIARLLELQIYIDSSLVNTQRSDGVIVATPTGSSAYALSSGGPLVHPSLDALLVVPICPHTLSSRPVVVRGASVVEIVLLSGEQPEAKLTCDGQTTMELMCGDRIHIRKHRCTVRLIHPPEYDYYTRLRTKLHWGRDI